jgi:hypothetical protein
VDWEPLGECRIRIPAARRIKVAEQGPSGGNTGAVSDDAETVSIPDYRHEIDFSLLKARRHHTVFDDAAPLICRPNGSLQNCAIADVSGARRRWRCGVAAGSGVPLCNVTSGFIVWIENVSPLVIH